MRIGVSHQLSNPLIASRPWHDLWQEHLWLFQEIEQLGFDFIGLQEHAFCDDAHGPPAAAFAGAILERTSSIDVGTWLTVLPVHHPAYVAQEWATLDQLSGGRTFLTLGAGYRPHEYRAHGLEFRLRGAMMEEAYAIVRQALTGERVTFHGAYWSFDDLIVQPPPLRDPYPVWGAARVAASAERAARHDCHLSLGTGDPAVADAYINVLRKRGVDPNAYRVSLPLSIHVTNEPADNVWARNCRFSRDMANGHSPTWTHAEFSPKWRTTFSHVRGES